MLRVTILVLLLVLSQGSAPAAASCVGADPAIVSATSRLVSSDGGANRYRLTVTVVNVGNRRQASNVLQFVDIFEHKIKLDSKGVPPLRPGQRYAFTYDYVRASDAGDGTASFRFQLNMRQPPGISAQNCSAANDTYRLVL
jgi:hypothetical protein